MALLFIDGFDYYATADIGKKWTGFGNSSGTTITSGGRRGGGCLTIPSNGGWVYKSIPATATLILGAAFYPSYGNGTLVLFQLRDGSTTQCYLMLNSDGTVSISRNGTVVATTTAALPSGAWTYVEWKITIADSIAANSCRVRFNGAEVLNVAAGTDVKNTVNAYVTQIALGLISNAGGSAALYADDFYACDTSGTTNNDFLGDCRIDTLIPNGDGTYSEWTPSTGTTHYLLVDDPTPNTTDYVSSTTVGARDTYALSDLTAISSQSIFGIQVNAAVLKDDSGAKSVAPMIKSGATTSSGTALPLSTSLLIASQIYEMNPNGSIAWTEAAVNALEAGVIITA